VTPDVTVREFDPRDQDAVVALDEWTLELTATDPTDIPGRDDLSRIEAAYLDTGGTFVVGIAEESPPDGGARPPETVLATHDGYVIAMGGYVPSEAGRDDERTVPGSAELHRMRVAPPYQGEGYGEQLLAELEEHAKSAGFETLLATTATRQERAIQFYPAHDYDLVDRSTFGDYELRHYEKSLE
jgi:GNAT superfamily N-acetyltransferase